MGCDGGATGGLENFAVCATMGVYIYVHILMYVYIYVHIYTVYSERNMPETFISHRYIRARSEKMDGGVCRGNKKGISHVFVFSTLRVIAV